MYKLTEILICHNLFSTITFNICIKINIFSPILFFLIQMLVHAVLASLFVGLLSATVVCPNGGHCPDKSTCCLTKEGYGCCNDPSVSS